MTHILQIVWPIVDETYTRSELIDEAADQLETFAEHHLAVLTGPPLWLISDAGRTAGWHAYAPGSVLVALAPAERIGTAKEWRTRLFSEVDHAAVHRAVHQHDPSGLKRFIDRRAAVRELAAKGKSDRQIGRQLGVPGGAVQKIRERNGITQPGREPAA